MSSWTAGDLRAFLADLPDDVPVVMNVEDVQGRLIPLARAEDARWWTEARMISDEPGEDGDGTERVVVLTSAM